MLYNNRSDLLREWSCGAAVCLSALGPGFFSGREIAFFYAQTGKISWLGILLCAVLYGALAGITASFAKRTGAASFPQIFRRSMGVYAGGVVWTLYVLALAVWAWIMLGALRRYSELMMPEKYGGLIGTALGVLLSLMLVHKRGFAGTGFVLAALSGISLLMLLWGKMPAEALMYGHIDLKLEGSVKAGVVLALLHGCRCMAVSAGVAVSFAKKAHPLRLGLSTALWTAVLLGLGNGVLMKQPDVLMALKEPFAAMLSEWGKAGYYIAALLMWMGAFAGWTGAALSAKGLLKSDGKKGC